MSKEYKTEYMMKFGRNLRTWREAAGLTQEELAIRAGYSGTAARTAVNKIETGSTDLPLSRVKALARALDCSPADLINCTPPQSRPQVVEVSDAESDLLEAYRALSPEGQVLALDYLRMLESRYGKKNHTAAEAV